MQNFDVAMVATISAENYEEALRNAVQWAQAIADQENGAAGMIAITDYEADNDGQRVLYLDAI
jgi:hypothetical protein